LVETAIRNTNIPLLTADCKYLKGLIFQAQVTCEHNIQGKFNEALEIFESIKDVANNTIMLDYGLGQLYVYKGEMEKSIMHFEKVLAKDAENYETTKVQLTIRLRAKRVVCKLLLVVLA
jgi:tetratricopeptide (TPR) repeat protein